MFSRLSDFFRVFHDSHIKLVDESCVSKNSRDDILLIHDLFCHIPLKRIFSANTLPQAMSENPLQAGSPPPLHPKVCNLAVASLVFGIGVFLLGPLAGIPAVITGRIARKKIAASGGNLSGQGMVRTGLFLGYLSIALTLVVLVFHLILLLVGAAWVYEIYQTPEKKVDFAPPVGIESR